MNYGTIIIPVHVNGKYITEFTCTITCINTVKRLQKVNIFTLYDFTVENLLVEKKLRWDVCVCLFYKHNLPISFSSQEILLANNGSGSRNTFS